MMAVKTLNPRVSLAQLAVHLADLLLLHGPILRMEGIMLAIELDDILFTLR